MGISKIINRISIVTNRNEPGSSEFFEDMIYIVENMFSEIDRLNLEIEVVNILNKILGDIVESMENKDYILTQDLLEYELIDCIKDLDKK